MTTDEVVIKVIEYLNAITGSTFEATNQTRDLVLARMKEGFFYEDFKRVIDKKCFDWKNTKYEQYLRPSTLFNDKFENYLHGKPKPTTKNRFEQLANNVAKAEQHDWRMGKK
jgi:uncharacterized phage protein (TIGR02220 family)